MVRHFTAARMSGNQRSGGTDLGQDTAIVDNTDWAHGRGKAFQIGSERWMAVCISSRLPHIEFIYDHSTRRMPPTFEELARLANSGAIHVAQDFEGTAGDRFFVYLFEKLGTFPVPLQATLLSLKSSSDCEVIAETRLQFLSLENQSIPKEPVLKLAVGKRIDEVRNFVSAVDQQLFLSGIPGWFTSFLRYLEVEPGFWLNPDRRD